MYHGLLPIPQLKVNVVLWDMALLCLGHGTQGRGEPMALYKVGTQLQDSCSLWQTQQVWEVQQRSIKVVRAERVFVTHLNDNAMGISERQDQRI